MQDSYMYECWDAVRLWEDAKCTTISEHNDNRLEVQENEIT